MTPKLIIYLSKLIIGHVEDQVFRNPVLNCSVKEVDKLTCKFISNLDYGLIGKSILNK